MAGRNRDRRKIEQALELLQSFLQITKTEYEMYFMGIQRKPPKDKHRQLKRMFREMTEMGIQNTAQRFKLKVVRARYNSLSLLWNRTCKQIEEGTYTKHRIMADKRDKARADGKTEDKVQEARRVKDEIRALIRGDDVSEEDSTATTRMAPAQEESPSPAAGPAQPAPRRPAPARRGGHQVGSRELVDEFASVRKELGLDGRVNARALEARLRKHEEIVKARTGCREVRFRVVAEDGKPRLKAIPVK